VRFELEEPVERTAPGQIACLYAGDVVVGYATIEAQPLREQPSPSPAAGSRQPRAELPTAEAIAAT
jgi:hypothetical protein